MEEINFIDQHPMIQNFLVGQQRGGYYYAKDEEASFGIMK